MTSLDAIEFVPYLDDRGQLLEQWQGKIGVYAIFDVAQRLQLVDYSRDIFLSLKQHLVRQPAACHWVKVHVIDRPNRTELTEIQAAWIAGNGEIPVGNGVDTGLWHEAIDCRPLMTAEEQQQFADLDELGQGKLLKQVARRIEAKILEQLKIRGVQAEIRFNPKLKDQGLLDLKS
jgi:hypothetical protein